MHRATSSKRRNMPLAASQTVYAPHDAFLKRSAKKDGELICLDLVFLARRLAAAKNRKNRQSPVVSRRVTSRRLHLVSRMTRYHTWQ